MKKISVLLAAAVIAFSMLFVCCRNHADNVKILKLSDGVKLEMVKIKAGTSVLGSPENEKGHMAGEEQYKVTISQDYWLGKYELTRAQWEAVTGEHPSYFKGRDDVPMVLVSWDEAMDFCKILTK